jgi:N-formylglutamate amidohydrolase
MAEHPLERLGDAAPASPVVLSVPHAGRDYPPALLEALRVPAGALVALEDRHIDAVARAAAGVRTTFIAIRPRAWIDLNRAEDERDPRVDEGAIGRPVRSAKVRGGLGLVPRRAANATELWRRRFGDQDIVRRIQADHRPYHAALASALAAARDRFGVAVLVDLHSMPSLGAGQPRVVIGDRFGRSAGSSFVARVEAAAIARGHAVSRNTPYAGAHILDRHGTPARGIHAIQVELDRTLYLDAALDRPGKGLAAAAALVERMLTALEDEAVGSADWSLAAE